MKLTRTERWILSNQLNILGILDPDHKNDFEVPKKIIEEGYEYLYSSCIQYISPDDEIVTEAESMLVLDILSMFRAITQSLERMEDKTGIDVDQLKFGGFDGNEEGNYYSFAKFFCTEYYDQRFPEIGTGYDNFNSHFPILDVYKRMLQVWKECKNKYYLTKEELIQIGRSTVHPSNR
jgi:uncharacterized protein